MHHIVTVAHGHECLTCNLHFGNIKLALAHIK